MMLTQSAPGTLLPADADAEDLRLFATRRDAEAFARVVRRQIDLVYSLCYRELRDAHLAEDATQAVFILLARKASGLTAGRGIAGWLYSASRNCCRNARRAQVRRLRHEAAAAMERKEMKMSVPTAALESEEIAQAVHAALGKLPRRDRDLLLMRYFQRQTARQVAELLAISEEGAKQRLARATRKLREILRQTDATAWLEGSALLSAPGHLALAAAKSATASAAGAPALIAQSVTSAAKAKAAALLLAGAVAAVVAVGGAVHLAAQSPPAPPPAPPAPIVPTPLAQTPAVPTPPAAAPVVAAANDEAKERATPLACIRAVSAREKALDAAGVEACLYDDGSDTAKILQHCLRVDISQLRLSKAMIATFGPNADIFHEISHPPAASVIDLFLATAAPEIQISGDSATMPLRQGLSIHFVRSPADGSWKINLAFTLTYISYVHGRATPAAAGPTIEYLDTVAEVADRVSGEISRHEIASPELVATRFNLLLNQARTAKNIQITGGQTVPRADAARSR